MAKDNPRALRLGAEIQRELTELLRRDVKDERIGNVTITAVDVTGDLRSAKVYYLIFGRKDRIRRCSVADECGGIPAQRLVQVFDDPLHPDADVRARHVHRARRAIDPAHRLGQQARGRGLMTADVHGILLLDKPLGLSSAGR